MTVPLCTKPAPLRPWFDQFVVEELRSPAPQSYWKPLQCWLQARISHPASVAVLPYRHIFPQNVFSSIWFKVCSHLSVTPLWVIWMSHSKTRFFGMELNSFWGFYSLHSSGKTFHKILEGGCRYLYPFVKSGTDVWEVLTCNWPSIPNITSYKDIVDSCALPTLR